MRLDLFLCPVAGYTASCIKYDFSVNPISVHQPLTRILAGLLAILNRDETTRMEDILKKVRCLLSLFDLTNRQFSLVSLISFVFLH